ncbi:MAG TPA: ATP synthase F0 subunit A [Firmicutes bacterium]|nr:ATP synthase F0 subunit A [Bacillota bacterium]
MSDIGVIRTVSFDLGPLHIVFNPLTVIMTWIVIAVILILFIWFSRKRERIPGRRQAAVEMIIEMFDDLVAETIGKDHRRYLPLVLTIFIFVLFSNWTGVIPLLQEPTKDLNTPLGLALVVFLVTHFSGVKYNGIFKYLKSFFEPIAVLFPINVVGELGKFVALFFRLFGNIFGGSVIIWVAYTMLMPSWWTRWIMLALGPFMAAFFGLFVGLIQAFVFMMLSMTYIAVAKNQ